MSSTPLFAAVLALLLQPAAPAQTPVSGSGQRAAETSRNRAERLEWLRDQGFGLFIHWSVDSQLGSVISHSMVAADEDYLKRFVDDLPFTFNPRKFNPRDWAVLARLAGMRYVVFTAKHHSGFCMFDTATTDFNIMRTPFHRDITAELLAAFREQGIAPGVYFSPDDFWWLYKNGKTIQRGVPDVQPRNNPGLMKHDQDQVRELMTNYGPIDVIFFDGEAEGLRDLAWDLQPNVVVTRGAIQTPEQYIPGVPLEGAWEANLTMGTQWQYKPTNESYKSGGQLISTLIETRAKGGNLLLNVGPKPDGELPIEQEERLREIALWMFINGESIYAVRPWVVTNENGYWFTKKNEDTVYVFVKEKERWRFGEWKDIVLRSIKASAATQVSLLGQNDKVLEYNASVVPKTTWRQEPGGLHIRAMRAQRIYNDRRWPNPVVLKITHAQPALTPPRVETGAGRWDAAASAVVLEGSLLDLGQAPGVEAGFEYRNITGQDVNERTEPWTATALASRTAAGPFTVSAAGLKPGSTYEYRAVVKHPLLTIYGAQRTIRIP
jgi:alpha-L-fucosidase